MAANSRRRIIFSLSLASLLLGSFAGAGYYAFTQWQPGEVAKPHEDDNDLEQKFADDNSSPLAKVADHWVDTTSEAPVTVATYQVRAVEGEVPAADVPLPPLAASGPSDRYSQPAEPLATMPSLKESSLPDDQPDPYATATLPPLEQAPTTPIEEPTTGSIEVGAPEPQPTGFSPAGALPPLGGEQVNPLRSGELSAEEEPSRVPVAAQQAFEAESFDAGESRESALLGSTPETPLEANPLRIASVPVGPSAGRYNADEVPSAGEFAGARPLNAGPAGDDQRPTLAPMDDQASYSSADLRSSEELPPSLGADEELSASSLQNHYQLEPTPTAAPQASGMPTGGKSGAGRPGEQALEGPQRPALVLQKFAPAEIQIGKPAKFVIKLRNVGQRPAEDVQVIDEIPQGTELMGTTPQADSNGGQIQWNLGSLSPGEERSLEIELMPTEEGDIGSVAKVTFATHASAKTRCTRPQLAIRLSSPPEVLVGRQQPVTIELHNPGTGDATGVMLIENVPDNVSHQAGPVLEFEVGTLRAGETRRMELILTAEKAGRVVNVMTAQADGNLHVQQQVEFEVVAPSLAVDIDGPAKRYLERTATYTVTVDNPGTAPARDVQLVTKLPTGMQFRGANNLGQYDSATHSVYWSLAELPAGEKGVVELVTLPVQPGDHTLEVEGRAREGLRDRTTQQVTVEGLAAIMFEVADTADPIEVGGTTSYDIRVVNQGSKAASNVQVKVMVPQGMKVTGATGETRHVVEAEGVIFAPLTKLAPKADSVFRVQLEGTRPGDQRVTVEVTTAEISQPIRKEESTRVFGDE